MNGAEALIRTLAGAGVELCFANPGTTEMHLVAALDAVGMRAVLGLFEGVCTGAADGYGRMADKPALLLLHLGPGFANGAANLHNARRARTPVVCVVGDHATWHAQADAPLKTDLESLAWPVSDWVHTAKCADDLSRDGANAFSAATAGPGAVATLIVPADCAWGATKGPLAVEPSHAGAAGVEEARIEAAATRLGRAGPRAALLLGARGLRRRGLDAAGRIAAASGCALLAETFPARMERGAGVPLVAKLPYFPEEATALLGGFETLVLAGAPSPVAFFGYPNLPSSLVPQGCAPLLLAEPRGDVEAALEALADALGGGRVGAAAQALAPTRPTGRLDATSLGAAVACVQPEGAIVVDEALTSALPWTLASLGAPPHTLLTLTGGAIGQGLPCATGAAIACPDRPVIALQADGSGLYTLQSLWTQAHEGLNVTTVVCANRHYRILRIELARAGIAQPGPSALALTAFDHPAPDWVALARGFGVPALRVETAETLCTALSRALGEPGPHLIEAVLEGPAQA
ncbi:MAG TPA: acetolactate synthase large subunit [Deltaproteobacteria bacterium]|nr:acetolactate synthase large subunit [Deltaproteobacteria bacterium]